MGRSIEITGRSIVYLFYAVSLAVVALLAAVAVWPLEDLPSVLGAVALAMVVLVVVADLWYWRSGAMSEHLSTAAKRNLPYDITYDPFADPGQAAKDRWLKATRRLREEDDED
jgi:glucan phosphoethanolaminetransferase (alkaline phosphatase superfamily)